jgi:hypothetical protein
MPEHLLAPWRGPTLALPLGGLLLALLVVGCAVLAAPWLLRGDAIDCRRRPQDRPVSGILLGL